MMPVSPELITWVDFFAKIGQLIIGLLTLSLAGWALFFKRKEFFKSELTKRQLDELDKSRAALQSIAIDIYHVPTISQTMNTMSWNQKTLQENDPDSWEIVERYKRNSTSMYYKLADKNYYLYPKWIDREKTRKFAKEMEKFAPFTLFSISRKSSGEIETYVSMALELKDHFDEQLRKNA